MGKTAGKGKFIHGITFNSIIAIAIMMSFFCVIVSTIGYLKFTDSLTKEYNDSAMRTAHTAETLVNADHIEAYLNGEEQEEYELTLSRMETLCNKQNVTFIYVIAVDEDYKAFTSVFNTVNENSKYSPWELGYRQNTTNEQYEEIYRKMYEEGLESAHIVRDRGLHGLEAHITFLIPITKTDGTAVAILCVQRPMQELATGRRGYVFLVVTATVLLAALEIVLLTLYLRSQVVRPLKKVVDEARRFAIEGTAAPEKISGKISRISEISDLATAIGKMEGDTLEYVKTLTLATAEKEKMGTELQVASLIQESMLPSEFPPFPDRKEFDLYAAMKPAKEVGGDFYDFYFIDDDHLAMVIADVSGKGIPAALFMMVTKIILKERALAGGTPAEVLEFVNDRICSNNVAEMFVTVWLGILELSTGRMIAANAGHDDPAICKKDGKFAIVKNKHGMVIGGFRECKYKNFEILLEPGDKIFLYTDGLPEATDASKKMFKLEGMVSALNECSAEGPENILSYMWNKTCEFVGDAPQFDDLTMLCVEYKGYFGRSLTLPAKEDNLVKAQKFIENILVGFGASKAEINRIATAFEEIFVNVCCYAYGEETGEVGIFATVRGGMFSLSVSDSGRKYDPMSREDPDVTLSAEDRDIGGLGIFMTKKLMDNVYYEYKDGKNILTMEKKIGQVK